MGFDIKRAFVKAIEKTGNPLAPVILQEAYGRVEALGQMFAECSDRDKVEAFADRLTAAFAEEDLDKHDGDPEFIMALAGLLSTSLVRYGSRLGGEHEQETKA